MRNRPFRLAVAAGLVIALFGATEALADPTPPQGPSGSRNWWFGVRAGRYFDVEEPALGVEVLVGVANRVFFNPNVEVVLVDGGNLMTFNGDFHYDFPTRSRALVWAGAGLAAVYADPDGPGNSDTDLGGNFFAGLGYNGAVIPYVQAKLLVAEDNNEFVLMGGIRF